MPENNQNSNTKIKIEQKKKVLVAMSGGVDSSVAAALLKMQGYDVSGVYFQVWQNAQSRFSKVGGSCCSVIDEKNVEKMAAYLEVPLYIVNLSEEFKYNIIEYTLHETIQMRKPNPCVMCNHSFKFDALLKKAKQLKCEYVATGHYAKLVKSFETSEVHLFRAVEEERDQSFNLFGLSQEQLSNVLMPLGDLTKSYILKMARNFKLPVIESRESRAVCFVDDGTNKEMVQALTPESQKGLGTVDNIEGRIMGKHQGLFRYSVGQKAVFPFILGNVKDPVILSADLGDMSLTIGTANELVKTGIVLGRCNWIGSQNFIKGLKVMASFGLGHKGIKGSITLLNNKSVYLNLEKPVSGATPGQPIAFYVEDQLIGGGWIEGLPEPDYRNLPPESSTSKT